VRRRAHAFDMQTTTRADSYKCVPRLGILEMSKKNLQKV